MAYFLLGGSRLQNRLFAELDIVQGLYCSVTVKVDIVQGLYCSVIVQAIPAIMMSACQCMLALAYTGRYNHVQPYHRQQQK